MPLYERPPGVKGQALELRLSFRESPMSDRITALAEMAGVLFDIDNPVAFERLVSVLTEIHELDFIAKSVAAGMSEDEAAQAWVPLTVRQMGRIDSADSAFFELKTEQHTVCLYVALGEIPHSPIVQIGTREEIVADQDVVDELLPDNVVVLGRR